MADIVRIENVHAELFRESDPATIYSIRAKISIKGFQPDKETSPVKWFPIGLEIGTLAVPDGRDYVVRCTCSAGPVAENGRVEGGRYLAGR